MKGPKGLDVRFNEMLSGKPNKGGEDHNRQRNPSSIFIKTSKGENCHHAGAGSLPSIKYAWNLNNPNGLNMLELPWQCFKRVSAN